ncbi:SAR2788 family putative toxin [Aeribacillus sp. FSL K6-2833]|uniref:SAR2788 family putative toxin n=1 Tax=Aeribacillus sp. FSL K6-2833 TaxID=2954611 RepID=UPI0030D796A9
MPMIRIGINNAEKIKPTIQNLDSNGIKLQLDIDTDEYATDLIIDSNLKGNDITVSSVLDVGDKIEKTVYDVKIIENTEEQFKAILIEKNTGEQITISENEAKASVISVVVRIIGGAIKYVSKQSGKQVTKSAAKKAKLSFSSGRAGEKYLETLVKVRSKQEYFRTPLGGRYIDVLDTSGIGHESKVGYVSLNSTIRKQIDKDALLIKKKELKGAKWHFFRSDTTGKVGASKPVLNYLKSKGIPYKIYK